MTRFRAFVLGMREFRRSWTWSDPSATDENPYTHLDHAYDVGRDLAHRLTFRVFEGR